MSWQSCIPVKSCLYFSIRLLTDVSTPELMKSQHGCSLYCGHLSAYGSIISYLEDIWCLKSTKTHHTWEQLSKCSISKALGILTIWLDCMNHSCECCVYCPLLTTSCILFPVWLRLIDIFSPTLLNIISCIPPPPIALIFLRTKKCLITVVLKLSNRSDLMCTLRCRGGGKKGPL